MNKIITAIVLLSVSLLADIYNLKPIKITKDIHCVIGDFNPPKKSNGGFVSNVCYVDLGDSIALIDAGPTYLFAKELDRVIKKEYPGKKISYVILTNYHDDRILGSSYFKERGAKIVGYKTINDDIKKNPEKFERMAKILDKKVLKGTKLIYADTLVDDGYKIKGSKKILTIIKPSKVSEERSDIAVFSKDDSFIFAGNIVFNGRMLNYTKNSNIDGWIEALKKLSSMHAKYLLGGHGKEYDANSYKFSLNYLIALKDGVKKAYERDLDLIDVVKSFNVDRFKHMKYFNKLHYSNVVHYYNQLEFED